MEKVDSLLCLNEGQICTLETIWRSIRSKGVRVALVTTFGGGWNSVMKEAGKHCLKEKESIWMYKLGSLWIFWFRIYYTNYKIC